jgi:hypothetical protein
MTLQTVLAFFQGLPSHVPVIVLVWCVFTAIVNLITNDPAEVEGAFEKWPAYAHFATMLRKWGIDPVAGWRSLAAFVAVLLKKNAPPGAPPMTDKKKEESDGEG